MYCAEQIKIPSELPDILKEFTKAAIRTQPVDVLQWSTFYFEALFEGHVPPTKAHLEPSASSERLGGISKGVLAILHKQLGHHKFVTTSLLRERWCQAGCNPAKLDELLSVGDIQGEKIEWEKLLAVACTALEKSLSGALRVLCEVLSTDSEGGGSRIPLEQFSSLYNYLVIVDGGLSKEKVSAVMQFLSDEAKRYGGKVGPREFTHSKCPRLDAH
eukprot:Em0010g138a